MLVRSEPVKSQSGAKESAKVNITWMKKQPDTDSCSGPPEMGKNVYWVVTEHK